eukprot:11702-Heterococcus_DN1.PRE.4
MARRLRKAGQRFSAVVSTPPMQERAKHAYCYSILPRKMRLHACNVCSAASCQARTCAMRPSASFLVCFDANAPFWSIIAAAAVCDAQEALLVAGVCCIADELSQEHIPVAAQYRPRAVQQGAMFVRFCHVCA